MQTAEEIAATVRAFRNEVEVTGEYSTEASYIIRMAVLLADVADRLAQHEVMLKADLTQIVDRVIRGERPPPTDKLTAIVHGSGGVGGPKDAA